MDDTFNLEVKIPDFVKLLGEEGKNQILEEVKKKVDKDVSNIVIKAAREIMAEKLGLETRESPFGPVHTKKHSSPAAPEDEEEQKSDLTCPSCQKPLESGVKFCRFCGQKIG
ncbi:MAG: hypothetical protein APG12_00984 [Candidatus Methanofastidiosum methylothiophilum]|uniref:Zinc-ribbon domain-containing protein n=1 Tax=Candidatus Methanofastidiosum methylothiophilum TaxID=1705564 RepID=A0A150IJ95_9EURY|nr:MAG: hypothetical protein APG10_01202 [Candidatus Methanofastidiosum methylthiophilus]KYC47566.1 MAG: hypothetical protein APG11_01067 [Candidatus Methanofastidiosum methylthiophilus]KYC50166.1 MAG: hypothetical protein APG12_00984 [Candidatus Methanofastidiosum methylthiophilus]